MNKKNRKILEDLWSNPVKSNIQWSAIETMLKDLGAEISEGKGSRVRVVLNNIRAVFHRPHPRKETDKGAVMSLRRFLHEAGVQLDA